MQREAKARYLQMLHQSVALSSKVMLRDAVQARTLRLNDRCTPCEMTVTDFESE